MLARYLDLHSVKLPYKYVGRYTFFEIGLFFNWLWPKMIDIFCTNKMMYMYIRSYTLA